MLQLVYYGAPQQFIEEMSTKWSSGDTIWVAPSPSKTDALREQLQAVLKTQVSSITMAKFLSELVAACPDKTLGEKVKRKADLLLIFGALRSKYAPDLSFEEFTLAYNIFSEVRSFSLDLVAMESVLAEYDEKIRKAVLLFWQLLEGLNYFDEHALTAALAENLRGFDFYEGQQRNFIFWGFAHLNGQQIDLLKALSIRHNVIVPLPAQIQGQLKRSDWPSWLVDHKTSETVLEKDISVIKVKRQWINTRTTSVAMKSWVDEHPKQKVQILIGVNKLTPNDLHLIPLDNFICKVPIDWTKIERSSFHETLISKLGSFEHTHALKEWLITHAKSERRPKELKVVQLYLEALKKLEAISDESWTVDEFFLNALHDVTGLNAPRLSTVPLVAGDSLVQIFDLSQIDQIDSTKPLMVVLDERFDEPLSLQPLYSEKIEKELMSIGPIKRPEFELHIKRSEFLRLMSGETTVFLPPELLKHQLIWKRFFENVEWSESDSKGIAKETSLKDVLKKYIQNPVGDKFSYSASKIQNYVDCPQKFYFQYIDKIFPRLSLKQDIDPMDAGLFVHHMIELYLASHTEIDETKLWALVKKELEALKVKNQLNLNEEVEHQRSIQYYHRTLNGLSFLKQLAESVEIKPKWEIESSFEWKEQFKLLGQIDCFHASDDLLIVLDFKSSSASASNFTEVKSLESLQLWVYLLEMSKRLKKMPSQIIMGYVVLESPQDSRLLVWGEEAFEKIKSQKFSKVQLLDSAIEADLEKFSIHLDTIVQTMKDEKEFKAMPRKKTVCMFCDLSSFCLKGNTI